MGFIPSRGHPVYQPLKNGNLDSSVLGSAPQIAGISTATLFLGVQNVTAFNHQIKLALFGGLVWACWSQSPANEGDLGSHVVYATSADGGATWSAVQNVTPVNGARVDVPTGGWWIRNGELYCLYYTDTQGSPHSTSLAARYRKWNGSGFDAEVLMFSNFLVHFSPIPTVEGDGKYVLMGWDNAYNVRSYRGDLGAWTAGALLTSSPAVVDLQEMTVFKTRNLYQALFRNSSSIPYELRSFSYDGLSWLPATLTNYPQAASNHNVLQLSDGRYVFANNPNQDGTRTALVLGVSDDGVTFTRFGTVRSGATSPRYAGTYKSDGYQYPSLLEKDGYLLVGYSLNKEDIQVSRFALSNLP